METQTLQLCQPCFERIQSFGFTDWLAIGTLAGITIVSLLTKKNLFSLSGSIYSGVVKGGNYLAQMKSKKK